MYLLRRSLVVNIDAEYLSNTVRDISNGTDGSMIVLDAKGTVLSHTDSMCYMQDFSQKQFVRKILYSNTIQGYLFEEIDGQKQLITYVKSDKLKWTFISISSYSRLLSNIYKLRNMTLVTGLSLLLLGIILSFVLTSRLYNPLKTLIKKINPNANYTLQLKSSCNEYELLSDTFSKTMNSANSLELSLKTAIPAIREAYLCLLLKGNAEDLPHTPHIMEDLNAQLNGPNYCVIIFKIDDYSRFIQSSSKDQALFRFAIANIAQELVGKTCRNSIVSEKDQIILLTQPESQTLLENLLLTLVEMRDVVKRCFNFSVSISVGDTFNEKVYIHKSYKTAMEYINYRLFFGNGCIIDSHMIKNRLEQVHDYPCKIENERLHFTPNYLGRLFKNVMNKSFSDYVNILRLEKARELLQDTDYPSATICEKVGLSNNTYFFTLFKKAYGMTPTHFRNTVNSHINP